MQEPINPQQEAAKRTKALEESSNPQQELARRNQALSDRYTKGVNVIRTMTPNQLRAQRAERFDYIRYLIRKGKSAGDVTKLVAEKFGISLRQAAEVKRQFRVEQRQRKAEREATGKEDLLIVLQGQVEDCIEFEDRANLLKTIQIISKLEGYDAPTKIETKQEVSVYNNLDNLSVDELATLVQLQEKAGAARDESEQ